MADNKSDQEIQAAPAVSDQQDERVEPTQDGDAPLVRDPRETLEAFERRVKDSKPPTV